MRTVTRERPPNCPEKWCSSHVGNCRSVDVPHTTGWPAVAGPGQTLGVVYVAAEPDGTVHSYRRLCDEQHRWSAPQPLPAQPDGPWQEAVD